MGALWLVIYDPNRSDTTVDIEMTNKFMTMKNRGPDDTAYFIETTTPITAANMNTARLYLSKSQLASYSPLTLMYGFHRMSINDPSLEGAQPFVDPIASMMLRYPELKTRPVRRLMCNGEIYNYRELITENKLGEGDLCSSSDVEVMMPLYISHGLDTTLEKLDGEYSFVIMDNVNTYNLSQMKVYVGRDPLGLRSLYMVTRKGDTFWMFASELKGIPRKMLEDKSYSVVEVPPGSYWSYESGGFKNYSPLRMEPNVSGYDIKTADPDVLFGVYTRIRDLVTKSVIKRYGTSDVPVGILLSGGFDSCLITSIVVKNLAESGHDFEKNPVHVFTVGDSESDDVMNACACVSFLETKWGIDVYHHIITQKGYEPMMDIITKELVYIMESQDVEVINGGVPLYLLYKYISENTDIKVLLLGDGLDEIFKIDDVSYDRRMFLKDLSSKRLDRLSGHFGLEARYPYLNVEFIEYILKIDPKLKCPQVYSYGKEPIKKYLVRKAFDTGSGDYLEGSTLWRPSGNITEAVGYRTTADKIGREYSNYFC